MTAVKQADKHRHEKALDLCCHFVTQVVSQAAEVKWDTAVGESKVMLTALVNLFLCDSVCYLSG